MVKLLNPGAEEDDGSEKLINEIFAFFVHVLIALAAWIAMMMVGYTIHPASVPQVAVFALSMFVPLVVGYLVMRFRPNEMAAHIWLAGIIWLLFLSLWIIDLPTGPNACNNCSATEKIVRTLFSIPSPSGLLDDNGPFFGTWPAMAMIGYAIGAGLVLTKKKQQS
jgi:hypothetical protein